jgi:hypothetical protein
MVPRSVTLASVFSSLLLAAACAPAYADRLAPGPSRIAIAVAPAPQRAPYDVQILDEDGVPLRTYRLRDRFYIEGSASERYVIRVSNPTPRRVEAVVSVDGLDVIDGEAGDLGKRGYIIPAYGETRIEGFRTSTQDVATFRFSAVGDSYAGRKGKARNVGVIAVALFEEQAPPEIVDDEIATPMPLPRPTYRDEVSPDAARSAGGARSEPPAARDASAAKRAGGEVEPAPPAPPPAMAHADAAPARGAAESAIAPRSLPRPARERLGLGTEFGEQRASSVRFTRFVRAPGRPVAIAELRYNDTAGLLALGIPVRPLPDDRELDLRESADPFPGDRFARPPIR